MAYQQDAYGNWIKREVHCWSIAEVIQEIKERRAKEQLEKESLMNECERLVSDPAD